MALRVAGSALILALLFHFVPFAEAWQAMRRLPPLVWLAVLIGYFCAHLAGVNKYKLMLNGAGAGLTFAQAVRCYFAGLFSSLLLPSVAGGDVVKAGLALRLGRSKAGVLLGSLLDRLIDVAVLVALAIAGVVLLPGTLDPADRRVLLIIVAAVMGAGILAATVVMLLPARRFSYRTRRHLVRLSRAARSTARRPARVAAALGLGFVTQLGFVTLTTLLAAACGLHLPYRAWLFAWPLAKISAFLPISQAGIGVREATLAALLVPFGAAGGVVVGVGLAWETIVIAGGLLSGLISLLVGRFPAGQSRPLETGVAQR
jgi:uncharacterized membrane protein YbhN (UPF0104 family)